LILNELILVKGELNAKWSMFGYVLVKMCKNSHLKSKATKFYAKSNSNKHHPNMSKSILDL